MKNVCLGRVVHFRKPEEHGGPVVEGVAIIDSGQYAGQRVEFERSQCHLFENRLNCADLSQVFNHSELFSKHFHLFSTLNYQIPSGSEYWRLD